MIALTLPWPPSVNTYWRNIGSRTIISKAGRQYKKTVAAIVASSREIPRGIMPLKQRLFIKIELFPPDKRRRDVDNSAKAIIDAIDDAGVFEDDSQIDRLEIVRRHMIRPRGGVLVNVYVYMPE